MTNSNPTTEFVYDGDGGRVLKIVTGNQQPVTRTTYVGSLYEIDDGAVRKHVFAGANRVCTIEPEHTYYSHGDHLGSSNVITDENGEQVSLTEYTPYGTVSEQSGSYDYTYKFTGKELDASTGLYYYGARYYDHEIGRFISPDSIVQAPYDPQTLNRYAYCRNNPVKYVDPTGHFFWGVIIGAILGGLIGGGLSVAFGGDFMEGFITGAISGAFFFAAGGVIGSITKALELQGLAANAVGAGIHALAGGASGALGAVATGGDPGRAAPISAAAAGASYLLGNAAPFLKAVEGEFFKNAVKRAAIGAVVGGGVSSATGGDFATGAQQGAKTSAIAYVANCAMSEIAGKLRKAKEKAKESLNIANEEPLYTDEELIEGFDLIREMLIEMFNTDNPQYDSESGTYYYDITETGPNTKNLDWWMFKKTIIKWGEFKDQQREIRQERIRQYFERGSIRVPSFRISWDRSSHGG